MIRNYSAPFSVLDQPSNTSMVHYYETLAKNHLDQYVDLLLKKPKPKINLNENINLVGNRKLKNGRNVFKKDKSLVTGEFAMRFFQSLLGSFHDFQNYCENKFTKECEMFDDDNAILAKALKDYDLILNKI